MGARLLDEVREDGRDIDDPPLTARARERMLGKPVLVDVDAVEVELAERDLVLAQDPVTPGRAPGRILQVEAVSEVEGHVSGVVEEPVGMLEAELALGAIQSAVRERGDTSLAATVEEPPQRRVREAPSQWVDKRLFGRQERVMARHPVVALHDVQMQTGERVRAPLGLCRIL